VKTKATVRAKAKERAMEFQTVKVLRQEAK